MRRACMFRNSFITDEANPRIYRAWKDDGRQGYPPYSAFTKLWKQEHCSQLDPYGTDSCPYRRDDCVLAYMKTSIDAIEHHPDNVVAYFRGLARWRGAERADDKPLARMRYSETNGHKGRGQGLRAGPRAGPADDVVGDRWPSGPEDLRGVEGDSQGVRRTAHRFFSMGELLGRTDLRPRVGARGGDEGEAPADDSGDGELSLPEPSPMDEVGDEPSS